MKQGKSTVQGGIWYLSEIDMPQSRVNIISTCLVDSRKCWKERVGQRAGNTRGKHQRSAEDATSRDSAEAVNGNDDKN